MEIKELKHMAGIAESPMTTVANVNAFLEDLAKRLKGGKTVTVEITHKGPNVFEYRFKDN